MKKPLVYVAGPITGDPFGCVRQATDAWKWLRDAGTVPFLPQLSVLHEMVDPQPYEEWMEYDFDLIRGHIDGLVRLPGESSGADREVALAHELGIPVFEVPKDGLIRLEPAFPLWLRRMRERMEHGAEPAR